MEWYMKQESEQNMVILTDSLSSMKNIGNNLDSKMDIMKYIIGRAIEETSQLGKEIK